MKDYQERYHKEKARFRQILNKLPLRTLNLVDDIRRENDETKRRQKTVDALQGETSENSTLVAETTSKLKSSRIAIQVPVPSHSHSRVNESALNEENTRGLREARALNEARTQVWDPKDEKKSHRPKKKPKLEEVTHHNMGVGTEVNASSPQLAGSQKKRRRQSSSS